jgi:hypothetical protein
MNINCDRPPPSSSSSVHKTEDESDGKSSKIFQQQNSDRPRFPISSNLTDERREKIKMLKENFYASRTQRNLMIIYDSFFLFSVFQIHFGLLQ